MRQKRAVRVFDRVVEHEDVTRLARLLQGEFQSAKKHKPFGCLLTFTARSADGVSYTWDDASEFLSSEVLGLKRIVLIKMDMYTTPEPFKQISVYLTQGDVSLNSLEVESEENWATGIFTKFKEQVDPWNPQSTFLRRHSTSLILLSAFGMGRIFLELVGRVLVLFGSNSSSTSSSFAKASIEQLYVTSVLLNCIAVMMGWMPAMWLFSAALKLWPSVELQLGPKHTQVERRKRLVLSSVFVAAVLPLLLSVAYDLFKSLW